MGNSRFTLLIGMNMAGFYRRCGRLQKAFLIAVPIALLLLAGGGWLIARPGNEACVARSHGRLNASPLVRSISASPRVRARICTRLVNVINSMLDRLQKSFGQAVRFSADAAHELQTPLTVLQGELDDAVQHAPRGPRNSGATARSWKKCSG